MVKTGFLFSGQGAQRVGMGRDFYDAFDEARASFELASELLGYDLRAVIDGDATRLNGDTSVTQVALLVTSVAIARCLTGAGVAPDVVAGLSLGEYSALVASGALAFEAAVPLVAVRGRYMAEAAPAGTGKMVAVLKTAVSVIEACCQQAAAETSGIVSPANYNTPEQIVIGGEVAAVDRACALLTVAGAGRLVPLKVAGPFHTALLQPASACLAERLEAVRFDAFRLPLVANTTAQVMAFDEIKPLLTRQVMSPVRFDESVRTMLNLGVTRFVEVGAGKTLSSFVKKIVAGRDGIEIAHVDDLVSFEALSS